MTAPMAGGGLGPIWARWAAAVVPAYGHGRSPVGLSATVGAFFKAVALLFALRMCRPGSSLTCRTFLVDWEIDLVRLRGASA
jgi:hypothetical protein